MGIAAKDYNMVLGKKLKKPLMQWGFVKAEDLE